MFTISVLRNFVPAIFLDHSVMASLEHEVGSGNAYGDSRETRQGMPHPDGNNRREGDDRWKEEEILENRKGQIRRLPLRLTAKSYGGHVEKESVGKNHAQTHRQKQLCCGRGQCEQFGR